MSRPDETTLPERAWWWPDTRTWVSQLIAVAIHAILLIAIAAGLMYQDQLEQINPAELDVIEYEEVAEGPPVETVDESEIDVEAKEIEEQTTEEIEEAEETEAPEIELRESEIDRSEPAPEGWEPADWQQQLDDLAQGIEQLHQNVAQSDPRGGDEGGDPHSRGEQQKRWTIYYKWNSGCAGFGQMLKQIGIRHVGVISRSDIIYIDPISTATHRAPIDREARMWWTGKLTGCEADLLARAQYQAAQIIWFMDQVQEPVLEELEMEYAQKHGMDIAKVLRTVFTPYKSGGSWKLRVKSMR